MSEYSRSLGDAVKRARGKAGLTQNEVAEAIDRFDNVLKIRFTRKGVSSRVYK